MHSCAFFPIKAIKAVSYLQYHRSRYSVLSCLESSVIKDFSDNSELSYYSSAIRASLSAIDEQLHVHASVAYTYCEELGMCVP